jgi:DNA recombination protein RmuC
MTGMEGIVAVALVAAIILGFVWLNGRRAEAQVAALRQEMQNAGAMQAQAVSAQVAQLGIAVAQQLGQVRQDLQHGVASSGQLATDAQREVSNRLQTSTEALRQLSEQIGQVQKSSKDLSDASQALQQILGGTKTRGILGETALERLLEDALPRGGYETQFRFSTGDIVDAVVRYGDQILCIDSKFPLESYRRLAEVGESARKEFAAAVRKHTDSIAEKYILPNEHTMDLALMFIPSEGVYSELLQTEDGKYGLLEDYCRSRKVLPLSPNTCYAYLGAIGMSLRGLKVEENARRLMASLAGLEKQLDGFAGVYSKLGTHLRNAGQCYEDADGKLQKARGVLEQMSEGALPEIAAPAVAVSEAGTLQLPLRELDAAK